MMRSVEDELEEIKSEWDVKYLDETGDYTYIVELKKEEVTLRLSIPEKYPAEAPEFGEKEMKVLEEKMQRSVLRPTQQIIRDNLGKPMLGLLLENIMKHVKPVALEKRADISDDPEKKTKLPPKRHGKRRQKYTLACSWGMAGSNQPVRNIPHGNTKSAAKSGNDESAASQRRISQRAKLGLELEIKEKAPPMKTARDVINRLKWDDKLKDEEFIVGYEDRFSGIIEVPVFELNWQDDIAATGPADKLAIPEHRVQYFKYNLETVWEKSTKTDRIFGSTGTKPDILELIQKANEKQQPISTNAEACTGESNFGETKQPVVVEVKDISLITDQKHDVEIVGDEVTESHSADVTAVEIGREVTGNMFEGASDKINDKTDEKVSKEMDDNIAVEPTSKQLDVDDVKGTRLTADQNDTVEIVSNELTELHVSEQVTESAVGEATDKIVDKTDGHVSTEVDGNSAVELASPLSMDATTDTTEELAVFGQTVEEPQSDVSTDVLQFDVLGQPVCETKIEPPVAVVFDSERTSDQPAYVDVQSSIPSEINIIKDIMDKIILYVEGVDIYSNEVNAREASGGKRRHDEGRSHYHSSHDHRGGQSHRHHGHDGWGNKRWRGEEHHRRERGGSGGDWNYDQSDWYRRPGPANYCICGTFDESSQPELSYLKTKLDKVLKKPYDLLPESQSLYVNLAELHLESEHDSRALIDGIKHVCSTWSPCKAAVEKVFCVEGEVKFPLRSRSFETLLIRIQRASELSANLLSPLMRVAILKDNTELDYHRTFKLKSNLSFMISRLFVKRIGDEIFDDKTLLNETFDMVGEPRHQHPGNMGHGPQHRRFDSGPGRPQRRHPFTEKGRDWETKISKTLSAILRHQAMGFKLDKEGFIEVKELLSHQFFKHHEVNESDVVRIVETNAKKRFYLDGQPGNLRVRANQGHTVQVDDLDLKEITDPELFPLVVHGTNMDCWNSIRKTGLKRMRRNHIHMTTSEPHSGKEVISGMRNSSNCFVYIDIAKAMEDGIKFFQSQNGVILSEGVDGVIDTKYFKHASGIIRGRRQDLLKDVERPSPSDKVHSESSSEDPRSHFKKDVPSTSSQG